MGSFAYTCGVSKLPIHAGDSVRYLLLSENPYDDSLPCYPNGLWFPRTFPIKAVYNDYGSVEDAEEVGRDLWLEGLKVDLQSVGLGENTCHDVPTSKNMSWENLLDAIVERRVRVSRRVDTFAESERELKALLKEVGVAYPESSFKDPKVTTPVGVPTMQRARKLLGKFASKFCVDKLAYGRIRIRCANYGGGEDQVKTLTSVVPLFKAYATVITAGTYFHPQLLLYPKPGTKDYHGPLPKGSRKSLRVEHIMIREDVWQGLLQMPVDSYTVDDHRKAVVARFQSYNTLDPMHNFAPKHCFDDDKGPGVMLDDEIPYTVGLGVHWKLLLKKKLLLAEAMPILNAIGELTHVMKVLFPTRWYWEPSYSIGPQFGEWAEHAKVNRLFADIAERELKGEQEAAEDDL